jgi:hypothetical protein
MDLPRPQSEVSSAYEPASVRNLNEVAQTRDLETATVGAGAPQAPMSTHPSQVNGNGSSAAVQPSGFTMPFMQDLPAIADDVDLIEREWIKIAKEIVERTRIDPHAQNKEMNKVKADYLKKRYNKDIKLAEDS